MTDATPKTKEPKGPDIGLRQARKLCQLPPGERLDFIAEGLPIILASAQGFWHASQQLGDHPREARVLQGYAEEEAAKILILMDAVRCPPKLLQEKLIRIIGLFYNHLARLIYADAVAWKPMNLLDLRTYVDIHRRGHYLEGNAGEYILPNWAVYERESRLYADIEAHEGGVLGWNAPRNPFTGGIPTWSFQPPALRVAEAMQHFGLFTPAGLLVTSEIWGSVEYSDTEDHHDAYQLTERLLERLHTEGLILKSATREHASTLYHQWQIPMYNLDFKPIPVTMEELKAEQEREYWAMVGDPY